MKHTRICFILIVASVLLVNCSPKDKYATRWHWQEGTIVIDSPERAAGQQHALQLRCAPIDTVRVAFVGLGMRGEEAVRRMMYIEGTRVVALCDYDSLRAENCQHFLTDRGQERAAIYSGEEGYRQLCEESEADLVYVATDWDHHFPVAKCAMEHGKHVALEVPSAMNLSQIWQLIDLSEQKRIHCMILENCCYDWYEMNTLNMAQQGLLGEILHVEGAYIHGLDEYWNQYWHNPDGTDPDTLHWRLKYNMEHRGDIYPTHGLGPVTQLLNIHRGDRMKTLVAMDTKSVHGRELVEQKTGRPYPEFRNGDQTTTLIRTELGKVIEIEHNVMNPQPYNRLYTITGTRGYATKYPVEHYALSHPQVSVGKKAMDDLSGHEFLSDEEQAELVEAYQHPILREYEAKAKEVGGHGGMDFIMDSRLIYCLRNGLPLDMDVYDLAEWCCLAELGELSMDHGCAPVAVPDFTRGHWQDVEGFAHAY